MRSDSYVPLGRIDLGKPAANGADVRGAVYYSHDNVSGMSEELTDADSELIWQAPTRCGATRCRRSGSRGAAAIDAGMG